MSAAAIIFTHPPDYAKAELATLAAQRCGLSVNWVIDQADTTDGIPPSIPIIRSNSHRNGNLRGKPWIIEQLTIMASVGDGHDWVIKIDSDTVIDRLDWLESAADHHHLVGTFIGYGEPLPPRLFGGCYAIRSNQIERTRQRVETMPVESCDNEDRIIGMQFSDDEIHSFQFNSDRGMMAGWIWNDASTRENLFSRFSVITVHPDDRIPFMSQRDETERCMRYLAETLTHPPKYVLEVLRGRHR